ncbi:hypothetical protein N1I81_10010 [Bacillus sp. FSL M8-0052]|uniref:hypothetical protein n=1 Tax=Bacillus sp. FSL M8-0052 TaxID=2978203 RepID=UPI0030FCBDF9
METGSGFSIFFYKSVSIGRGDFIIDSQFITLKQRGRSYRLFSEDTAKLSRPFQRLHYKKEVSLEWCNSGNLLMCLYMQDGGLIFVRIPLRYQKWSSSKQGCKI